MISQVGFYRVQRGRQLFGESRTVVKRTLSVLIREILGNPFCSLFPDASFKNTTTIKLAQGIYHDRAFDRLPILADALEEAGFTDAEVLCTAAARGRTRAGAGWSI